MLKKTVMTTLSLLLLYSISFAGDKDAASIVQEIDKIMGLAHIASVQKMTIYRKDESSRVYMMDVMTSGDDKAFAEITAPPREKGRQMLRLGEVVWSYLPSVKKSIRVSGRSSFMGGDFENNDILRLNLSQDYVAKIVEETSDQYVLEFEGKDLSLSYAKIKAWVQKGTYQPTKQEYYTINGKLIKWSNYRDVKNFKGVKRPATVEMQSALSPKEKTILEFVEFERDVDNPAKLFRRSNLGK